MNVQLTSEEYVARGGTECPVCLSRVINAGSSDIDGEQYWQAVVCSDCNHQWVEFYTLAGYNNLEAKSD